MIVTSVLQISEWRQGLEKLTKFIQWVCGRTKIWTWAICLQHIYISNCSVKFGQWTKGRKIFRAGWDRQLPWFNKPDNCNISNSKGLGPDTMEWVQQVQWWDSFGSDLFWRWNFCSLTIAGHSYWCGDKPLSLFAIWL